MDLLRVISSEIIKPSSPTLRRQKTLRLSFIDQITPFYYTPVVLFNNAKDRDLPKNPEIMSTQLKQSLSHVLNVFYPLAGRVIDCSYIDCNDQGVLYSEANFTCPMDDFLDGLDKESKVLNMLHPCTALVKLPSSSNSVPQLVVRVTYFGKQSGVAICICALHSTMDAISMHTFLSSWAETMRDRFDEPTTLPNFSLGSALFPERDSPALPSMLSLEEMHSMLGMFSLSDGSYNTTTRRFLFKNEAIKTLMDRAKSEEVAKPTRYESLSAFIWKHIMEGSKKVHGSRKPLPCTAGHAVNIRRRMDPPRGNHCMGNFLVLAAVNHSGNIELPELVKRMHKCIKDVNSEALKLMEGERCHEVFSGVFSKAKSEAAQIEGDKRELVFFTSWCNMGFYELDFGWGKPNWVGICGQGEAHSGMGNMIFFLETNSRDGIEVTMTLEDNKMVALENDPQFLKFAIPSPSFPKS